MATAVVLWWNVHKMRDAAHADRVVTRIKEIGPDIFGLCEVVGEAAYKFIAKQFPGYNFYMTYGRESQEILVGVRLSIPVFFSQRTEFKSGNSFVRPAVLLTIDDAESPLNMLFAHPKSFSSPNDLGQRDYFFQKVFSLKTLLDKKVGGDARFIVCGDMNTMGMSYLEYDFLKAGDEIRHLSNRAGNVGLFFKPKNHQATYSSRQVADLDHVLASNSVQFTRKLDATGRLYDVNVTGWVDFPAKSIERNNFISNMSDHGLLSFEIELKI